MNSTRGRISRNRLLFAGLIIVVFVLAIFFYVHNHNKKRAVHIQGATSKPTPHQIPSTSTTSSPGQSGGAIDKNGQVSGGLPPSSLWVSSSSGNITLQQPTANTTVNNGDSITGLAKVNVVQFILKDDSVGQIAQGDLNVMNGKFAGVLQFTPHSKTGKLEIYHPNPNNGAEEDIIDINVSFNVQ